MSYKQTEPSRSRDGFSAKIHTSQNTSSISECNLDTTNGCEVDPPSLTIECSQPICECKNGSTVVKGETCSDTYRHETPPYRNDSDDTVTAQVFACKRYYTELNISTQLQEYLDKEDMELAHQDIHLVSSNEFITKGFFPKSMTLALANATLYAIFGIVVYTPGHVIDSDVSQSTCTKKFDDEQSYRRVKFNISEGPASKWTLYHLIYKNCQGWVASALSGVHCKQLY